MKLRELKDVWWVLVAKRRAGRIEKMEMGEEEGIYWRGIGKWISM